MSRSIARLLLLSLLAAAISATAVARERERDYRRLIERYDLPDTVLRAPDATAFWQLLQATDSRYHKTARALASGGHRDIKRRIITTLGACSGYFTAVPVMADSYALADSVIARTGLRGILPTAILTVTDEPDVALFSYPNGYFFMTAPLHNLVDGDTIMLTALMASEAAHYTLQHAFEHERLEARRARRNKWLRIAGAAVITAVGVALDMNNDDTYPLYTELAATAAVSMLTYTDTPRYTMLYTPEQIFQSDIIAYRFMEWTGAGGRAYIDALRCAAWHLDAASAGDPHMPGVASRLALLEYLDAHPELHQRARQRKARPRRVDDVTDIFSPRNYR